MKRFIALTCALLFTLLLLTGCESGEQQQIVNVYNWGEYISDGSEDTLDVNAAFEEYYYETYGEEIEVDVTEDAKENSVAGVYTIKNIPGNKDQKIFESGVKYFK